MTRAAVFAVSLAWLGLLPSWAWASDAAPQPGLALVVRDRAGKPVGCYRESHALLVGVSDYRAGWPDLESVPEEIDRMAEALTEKGFHVVKVLDPDCDRFQNALEAFVDRYGFDRDNRLLFFFAGHGYTRLGRKGYLVPADAPDPREDDKGFVRKAISMGRMLALAREIEAKHALFVFDSCFSGTIFKTRGLPRRPQYISDLTSRPVRQFISAGSAGETVPSRSVFTPLFIRAIGGAADVDRDGFVTGTELGMYLHREVLAYRSGQTPQYGKIRDPELDEGDFVFFVDRPSATPPPPTTSPALLTVRCGIPDARVYVDDRYAGQTPLEAHPFPPGRHRLRVEKEGHTAHDQVLHLEPNRQTSVYVELPATVSPTARLHVTTVPADAQVALLESDQPFQQGMALAAGRYRMEISAPGYGTKLLDIGIAPGEQKRLEIVLDRLEQVKTGPVVTNSVGMEFVHLPPGIYLAGSPADETMRESDEQPTVVKLTRGFYLQTTEVTQDQWLEVMGSNPSSFSDCGGNCPVENVSWNEAHHFIDRLNRLEGTQRYRLPSSAQWEYACRAGTGGRYAFGNNPARLGRSAWYQANSRQRTHPVKLKAPNAWGLYDMHGNVWEWCQDRYRAWHDDEGMRIDPLEEEGGKQRVMRGGGWFDVPRNLRCAALKKSLPIYGFYGVGFRVLMMEEGPIFKVQ
jgi:formylglycine-generating enzyme required for sulfatase activity